MKPKRVFVLEDNNSLRTNLVEALRDRQFWVDDAADADAARALVAKFDEVPDVCVLDMFLETSTVTGAQIGLEIRRRQPLWPPEFLIYTAFDEPEYYQQAIQLGAAKYLRKGAHGIGDVVRHVRVLSLRRALEPGRPGALRDIEQIAAGSQDRSEAVIRFWQEVVCPEFEATLGIPFLLLHSRLTTTELTYSTLDLPGDSLAYRWIRELLEVQADPRKQFILDADHLLLYDKSSSARAAAISVFRQLQGTVFISLGRMDELDMALGLVQIDRDEQPLAENAVALAELIVAYFRPALVNLLLMVAAKWTEIHIRQKAILETTSRFCLYVGQEQVSLVDRVVEHGATNIDDLAPKMYRLRLLGEELRAAGELLGEVASPRDQYRREEGQVVGAANLVRDVWEDLLIDFPDFERDLLEVEGDCFIFARPGTLYVAFARVLQWLAKRNASILEGGTPRIRVSCGPQESKILIRDASRRLSPEARGKLFSLVSAPSEDDFKKLGSRGEFLGLYLSKVLIEMESGGTLRDLTDSSGQETGHCLLIEFPRYKGQLKEATNA